jgi:hypothetical protein
MYGKDNSATKYLELTLPQFAHGYTKVTNSCPLPEINLRNIVFQEIMADANKYSWELVRSAHRIFLQQIEAGRIQWDDATGRTEIRSEHIWHAAPAASSSNTSSYASSHRASTYTKSPARRAPRPQQPFTTNSYAERPAGDFIMAKEGDRTCTAYNTKHCHDGENHKKLQHACEYCRSSRGRICKHPERICNRKYHDQAGLNY